MTPSKFSTVPAGSNFRPSAAGRHLYRSAGTAVVWLPVLCVLLPLVVVAFRAVGSPDGAWSRIVEFRLWDYLSSTGILIALVVLLTIIIGLACAWLVSAFDFTGRRSLEWLLILPLGVPGFVAGAAYLDGFEQLAPWLLWIREHLGLDAFLFIQRILPWFGAVLVLVVTLYPYVYMSCRASFAGQQADLIEAGRTLGCGPAKVLWKVALPLARPAIAAGAALVAMETANDYGVVSLFGIDALTPGVFRAWSEGSLVSAMRLALVLLTLVMFVLALERAQRGRRGYAGDTRERPLSRRQLGRGGTLLAWVILGVPLLLGFVWPVGKFVAWAIRAHGIADQAGYGAALFNSTWLALLACFMVVTTAFFLTAGRRAWRLPGGALLPQLASLGYAVPSALLAVGIGALVSDLAGIEGLGWLAMSASAFGLVFAYWIRFLAVGVQPVTAGFAGISQDLHAAARTLGQSASRTLVRVDLRLLKPALGAAAILCFVDVFKELTLTLVMRPFDFETLATLTFRLSSEGRIPEAALPALVLVGGGMLGVAAINHMLRKSG